jgi:hypothetical protein
MTGSRCAARASFRGRVSSAGCLATGRGSARTSQCARPLWCGTRSARSAGRASGEGTCRKTAPAECARRAFTVATTPTFLACARRRAGALGATRTGTAPPDAPWTSNLARGCWSSVEPRPPTLLSCVWALLIVLLCCVYLSRCVYVWRTCPLAWCVCGGLAGHTSILIHSCCVTTVYTSSIVHWDSASQPVGPRPDHMLPTIRAQRLHGVARA